MQIKADCENSVSVWQHVTCICILCGNMLPQKGKALNRILAIILLCKNWKQLSYDVKDAITSKDTPWQIFIMHVVVIAKPL